MKVYEFTDEELLNAVLDEVIEHPGFKYFGNAVDAPTTPEAQCQYINEDDEGECIIGCALVRIGVDPKDIKPFEGNGVCSVVFNLRGQQDELTSRKYTTILGLLNEVQSHQDWNYSWAESLDMAVKVYHDEPKIIELVAAKGL